MSSRIQSMLLAMALIAAVASCSTPPASDAFSWTLGHWHGVRRSGSDGRETPMTVLVEPLGDGIGQVECLRVETTGTPYIGFTVRRRDDSGTWRMVYVNSTEHAFARLDASTTASCTTWTSVSPARLRESRLISERVGERGWRKTQQFSDDGGTTWKVMFIDQLERDVDG